MLVLVGLFLTYTTSLLLTCGCVCGCGCGCGRECGCVGEGVGEGVWERVWVFGSGSVGVGKLTRVECFYLVQVC
jgi:hypothetical protein